MVALEDLCDGASDLNVPVCDIEPSPMVEVRTARQRDFGEQFGQCVHASQGINQQRLLPISQVLLVDAQVFFYDFIRLLQ